MATTWEMLGTGGPVIALLALMSLLSLTVIAVKLIQLWSVCSGEAARAKAIDLWSGGDRKSAKDAITAGRAPADRVMTYAMDALGSASVLAGGIWQALLTTAAGLLVAIPAAIAAGLFASRIERAAQTIESAVGRLMLADASR